MVHLGEGTVPFKQFLCSVFSQTKFDREYTIYRYPNEKTKLTANILTECYLALLHQTNSQYPDWMLCSATPPN